MAVTVSASRLSTAAASPVSVLRLSLSGAGFLGIFHLGAGKALQQAGVLDRPCQVAGASAGALVGAVLTTGTPLVHARTALGAIVEHTRAAPLGILTPGHSLVDEVRRHLTDHLPSDAHQRASGRLFVALTSVRAGEIGSVYHKSTFASRDELIDAVSASSDIPGVTGRVRATPAAGAAMRDNAPLVERLLCRQDVDGGLYDLFPDPWHGAERVAFVSPFAGVGFSVAPPSQPHSLTVPEWSPVQAARYGRAVELSPQNARRWRDAFFPPPVDMLARYEAEGHAACVKWMASWLDCEKRIRGSNDCHPQGGAST